MPRFCSNPIRAYELVLLGSNRTSKDLDVEIDASRVTFDQVITALESDPEFRVIPGTRRDAVRSLSLNFTPFSTGLVYR